MTPAMELSIGAQREKAVVGDDGVVGGARMARKSWQMRRKPKMISKSRSAGSQTAIRSWLRPRSLQIGGGEPRSKEDCCCHSSEQIRGQNARMQI